MINWNELSQLSQLDIIDNISMEKPVLIFKHSTRCSISRMALKKFEHECDLNTIECYFLDLLNHRDISNAIAARYNVQHQSPQLILIKDKKVIYHDSHDGIEARQLVNFI